jgi:monofunctional biosynthetic peptidoglycan transglycosylase
MKGPWRRGPPSEHLECHLQRADVIGWQTSASHQDGDGEEEGATGHLQAGVSGHCISMPSGLFRDRRIGDPPRGRSARLRCFIINRPTSLRCNAICSLASQRLCRTSRNLSRIPMQGQSARMIRILKYALLVIALQLIGIVGYGAKGYWDAQSDADGLRARADELIAQGRGGDSLGAGHRAILLAVEDPNFSEHPGVDFSTPGAGLTTITQSAAKRLAFEDFHPGIGKIRQTGYALGLESRLSKEQILALWLETLEMGIGPNGWMVGFHSASSAIYGRPPAELTEAEFIRLAAVLIAPASYELTQSDAKLRERTARIGRLVVGACAPTGFADVWLEGCRKPSK